MGRKWGDPTDAPSTYDKESLKGRIKNLAKSIETYKKSKNYNEDGLAERNAELKRWGDYYKDTYGSETPPNSAEPVDDGGARWDGGPQLDRPEAIEADPSRGTVRTAEEAGLEEAPAARRNGFNQEEWNREVDEAFNAEFGNLSGLTVDMHNPGFLGGGGGAGASQVPVGRIGKNKPQYGANGETVLFSGNRMMYTWAYNMNEQKNPFGEVRNLSYGMNGQQQVKPLGHTIPWDWIPFYCTPAEWESLNWSTHKIEIEEVGVMITPMDKSVFFTTGSTDSKPVSTEHAAYLFKYDDIDSVPGLMTGMFDSPGPSGTETVDATMDWSTDTRLAVPNYQRLRERLWGMRNSTNTFSTGRPVKGASCLDGIKRELESVLGLLLDKPETSYDFGSFLTGEHQDVFPITECLGKPFIQKTFKPKIGIVADPRQKCTMIDMHQTDKVDGVPYIKAKFIEDQLKDATILAHKNPSACFQGWDSNTTGENKVHFFTDGNSSRAPFHGPSEVFATNLNGTNVSMTNPSLSFASSGSVTTNFYKTDIGNAIGAVTDGTASVPVTIKESSSKQIKTWTGLRSHEVPSGVDVFGNLRGIRSRWNGVLGTGIQGTGNYKDGASSATFDYDLDTDYGTAYEHFSIQAYNSCIEKGNSFIPLGPDSDNFPAVIPEQPRFAFGMKPILANDPNESRAAFLKAMVTWKIDYFMKIKQTYIKPDLRFVERRGIASAGGNPGGPKRLPLKADYTSGPREYGMQVSRNTYMANDTNTFWADLSDTHPLERSIRFNNKCLETIKTGEPPFPTDANAFPNGLQSSITNTPHNLYSQRIE